MYNVGGMIGGDSPLSPRGEKYAAALPALILDNIGDAPLTVRVILYAPHHWLTAVPVTGLDVHASTYAGDRPLPTISQEDLEIAGRA